VARPDGRSIKSSQHQFEIRPPASFIIETFEKCFPLLAGFKFKEDENFNRRNTLSILRIKI
jgi:hypothetical protein